MLVELLFDDVPLVANPFAELIPFEPLLAEEPLDASPFAVYLLVGRLFEDKLWDELFLEDKALGELFEANPFAVLELLLVLLLDDNPLALKLFFREAPLFDERLLDDDELDLDLKEELLFDPKLPELLLPRDISPLAE
jgi:hypothetical protein